MPDAAMWGIVTVVHVVPKYSSSFFGHGKGPPTPSRPWRKALSRMEAPNELSLECGLVQLQICELQARTQHHRPPIHFPID